MNRAFFGALLVFATAAAVRAGSIEVIVTDPSHAAVPGAAIRVTAKGIADLPVVTTGQNGTGNFGDLAEGVYQIAVQKEGFQPWEKVIELDKSGTVSVRAELEIAPVETTVEATSMRASLANSDTNYRALREAEIQQSFVAENIELTRDVGKFVFRSGTISFVSPVLSRVTVAVFSGRGEFHLSPAIVFEEDHLNLITGKRQLDEEFESAVLVFTDSTYDELKRSLKTVADGSRNVNVLRDLHRRVRRHVEIARSMAEDLLQGDGVVNMEAEVLADLYNPAARGFFTAYINGRKHSDLRFMVRPQGALGSHWGSEEVALVNIDTNASQDGILYLTHYLSEWKAGTALNDEDRRVAKARHYKMDTTIGKNLHLAAADSLEFEPLRNGDRVFHLNLLPSLRVSAVTQNGKDIPFIQEPRKLDGGFYLVLPEPTVKGKTVEVAIEYEGDKVIHDEGGGSFSVEARSDWYPALNPFHDRASYDLTFRAPRQYTLVSVGREAGRGREEGYEISHWNADVPIPVAGFNYGEYKKKSAVDGNYGVEVYATSDLPQYLQHFRNNAGITPLGLASSMVVDTENALRCFRHWFGDIPFGHIGITEQPEFYFGQSWPSLVYLPVFAFLDEGARYLILGSNTFKFTEFVDEVAAHEVSHQWWGHLIGWNSYHDQWLSEGFATFSAGLFLEATEKSRDKYLKYWDRNRKKILEKTSFGYAPNDAGPVWMGLRVNTFKTANAYASLVYPKGAFLLHMLRYLMQDAKTGDADFVAMMHDFTSTYAGKNASSIDFMQIVEKHLKPAMDLDGNGKMNWFFREFLYGTEVGSYHLSYKLTPESDGKVLFTGNVTQSGVSPNFRMRIPIYLDFGKGMPVRMANIGINGDSTSAEIKVRLPQRPKKVMLNYNYDVLAREASAEEM